MTQTNCTVEVITTGDRLAEIGVVWDELVAKAGVNHPFLTHTWIQTWWEAFGHDAELFVLLVRAGDEPIAIAPLMRVTERMYGARHRCVRFIANDHSPRCDFIIASRHDDAYAAICEVLMSESADWHIVQLREVPAESRTIDELRNCGADHDLLAGVRSAAKSPVVSTTIPWQQYLETRSSKRRWFLRNRLKRLSKLGSVALETASSDEISQALQDGFRLEAAAWKGKAGTAIVCDTVTERFYTTLAQRAAAQGWLRLQFLTLNGRRIAFAYCLAYKERMFLLKPGFDPEFSAYSPGSLLFYLALQDCHSSAVVLYDFLGYDDDWKRQWADGYVEHKTLFLYAKRPLTRLDHYTRFGLLPRLRQARDLVLRQTT